MSEARRAGLVRIEVVDPFQDETVALAERLQVVLGLRAVHLAAVTHQATLGADLAGPIATAVEGMGLVPGDAVLMSSGRTVSDVAHAGMPPLTGVQLVPTVGGQADPTPWFQTNEITRAAAQRSGAIPAFLFAQALPSAAMRATLDEDPAFQHVVGLWGRAKGRSWASAPPSSPARRSPPGCPWTTPCCTRPPVTCASTSSRPTGRRSSSPAASGWSGPRGRSWPGSRTPWASRSARPR